MTTQNTVLSPGQMAWKRFRNHTLAWYSLMFLLTLTLLVIAAPFLLEALGYDHTAINLANRFSPSTLKHGFGTDELGRDVLLRILYGGRISLFVAFVSAMFAFIIGTTIGAVAGYFGGIIDSILMRFTDSVLTLPILPLMILLAAIDLAKVLPSGLAFLAQGNYASMIKLMLIVVFFGWMTVARLVRAEFLSLRERDFTQAARALGVSHFKIIFRHILPNAVAPIIVSITLSIGSIILYEAALSFLGLGIHPPLPSWGNMLTNAQDYIRNATMLSVYPGVFILLTVVAINFIGDGLRDAFDPKFVHKK